MPRALRFAWLSALIVSTGFILQAQSPTSNIVASSSPLKNPFVITEPPSTALQRAMTFDYIDAAMGFRYAAERGDSRAQGMLGMFYFDGTGVPLDRIEAYKWLSLAAIQGDKYVAQMRDLVGAEMTPSQLA